MSYDKYRNWNVSIPLQMNKLKEMVLQDLREVDPEDEVTPLELLDSFEAAVERAHTAELAEHLSHQLLFLLQPFLAAAINAKLPASMPMGRGRAAPAKEGRP